MEYTAPYTPQMNGVVERRIAVLFNGARVAMYAANFSANELFYEKSLHFCTIW